MYFLIFKVVLTFEMETKTVTFSIHHCLLQEILKPIKMTYQVQGRQNMLLPFPTKTKMKIG